MWIQRLTQKHLVIKLFSLLCLLALQNLDTSCTVILIYVFVFCFLFASCYAYLKILVESGCNPAWFVLIVTGACWRSCLDIAVDFTYPLHLSALSIHSHNFPSRLQVVCVIFMWIVQNFSRF